MFCQHIIVRRDSEIAPTEKVCIGRRKLFLCSDSRLGPIPTTEKACIGRRKLRFPTRTTYLRTERLHRAHHCIRRKRHCPPEQ